MTLEQLKKNIEKEYADNCGKYPAKVRIAEAKLQLLNEVEKIIKKRDKKFIEEFNTLTLCEICQRFPENNCSRCNKFKVPFNNLATKFGIKEGEA